MSDTAGRALADKSTKTLQWRSFEAEPWASSGRYRQGKREHEYLLDEEAMLTKLEAIRDHANSGAPDVIGLEFSRYAGEPFSASRVNLHDALLSNLFPYQTTGKLYANDDEMTYECTAALIGPGIIVTAAHCVTDYGSDDYYQDFEFVPAYFHGTAPYGVWRYTQVVVPAAFSNGTDQCVGEAGIGCQNDIALLKLESRLDVTGKPYALGRDIGWLGYGLNGWGFDNSRTAQVKQLGYPGSLDEGLEMQSTDAQARRHIEGVHLMGSRQDSGASGGPWIINFGEDAVRSEDAFTGEDARRNMVVSVTTAITLTESDLSAVAAPFTSSNVGAMMDALCPTDTEEVACVPDPIEDPADAQPDANILLTLEEPVFGETYSGIGNLRGWAISPSGIDYIIVYIDGEFAFDMPYYGYRPDVGARFPEVSLSEYSGFSTTYGYTNLSPGEHTIRVVAVASNGDFNEQSTTFQVEKFHKTFFGTADSINPGQSDLSADDAGISVRNLLIEGKSYDVRLEWRTATQGFEIVEIK